jgi:Fe-S cluster assembly scaffold protein SufB
MKINITTLEELKNLDLTHYQVEADTEIAIRLCLTDTDLEYPINVFHETPGFLSKVSIKIALFGKSNVKIPARIHVSKGARDSATDFKALVLLMSPHARATVTPGLFIEERNIQSASHGVVIKNIKDKDLHYLQARGIVKSEAREMLIPF